MKKFLQATGLIALFVVSFFGTEKTLLVVQDMDDLMIELKQKSQAYQQKAVEAVVDGDTFIPGVAGKTVDINKSYVKMKEYGKFNDSLLIYKDLLPKETVDKNYRKFVIGGNQEKRMVSLIFLVNEEDDISKIRSILKEKDIRATFFLDGNYLEKHLEEIDAIIKEGHTIGNYSYHQNYKDSSFVWIDTIIKRIGKQKQSYCYAEGKKQDVIDVCHLYQDITITPTHVLEDSSPLSELKRNLSAGDFIALPVTEIIETELPTMIQYIISRGYKLENLATHIEE